MQDETNEPEHADLEGSGSEENDQLSWLREQAAREERERAKRRRTEVRGTRLRPEEAQELDRRAAAAGLDASNYIRLMCLAERPELEGAREALRRVCRLVEEFEAASQEAAPTLERVHALREAVDRICKGLK